MKLFFIRRRFLAGAACLLAAAAIFYGVSYPAAVSAAATTRQLPIYCVDKDQKVCAISFDAAWGNEDTQQLIDILAKYKVKTTFFVVGEWVDKYPESVKALADAGHEVMNHSADHKHYNALSADEIIADVTACNEKVASVTGVTPTLIRCPYGEYDDHVISAIRSMGMEPIQWDVEGYATGSSGCASGFIHSAIQAKPRKPRAQLRYALACCAMLALALGGYRFYLTPVSFISVDVNPSVEMALNRFDRVVDTTAYNDDGARILQTLRLTNKPYTEAVELLLSDETVRRFLSEDAFLSFTVVSEKEEALLAGIQQCQGYAQANAVCHSANPQLMEDAHHSGLSVGKYQAFLELAQYDSTFTAEDCQAMSMRQIRDLIRQYRAGAEPSASAGQGNGHHGGNGEGHGGGYGYRGGRGGADE